MTCEQEDGILIDLNGITPEGSFHASVPLGLKIAQQEVELRVVAYFNNPTILGNHEVEGRTYVLLQTQGRLVRYRLERDSTG